MRRQRSRATRAGAWRVYVGGRAIRMSFVTGGAAWMLTVGGCAVAPSTAPVTMTPPGNTDTTTGDGRAMTTPDVAVTRWACRSGTEERLLEIRTGQEGCDLRYTRGGKTRSIATSRFGDTHCHTVRDKTRSNLERSGYRCDRVDE